MKKTAPDAAATADTTLLETLAKLNEALETISAGAAEADVLASFMSWTQNPDSRIEGLAPRPVTSRSRAEADEVFDRASARLLTAVIQAGEERGAMDAEILQHWLGVLSGEPASRARAVALLAECQRACSAPRETAVLEPFFDSEGKKDVIRLLAGIATSEGPFTEKRRLVVFEAGMGLGMTFNEVLEVVDSI